MIEAILRSTLRIVAMVGLLCMFPFIVFITLLEKIFEAAANQSVDKGVNKTGLRND